MNIYDQENFPPFTKVEIKNDQNATIKKSLGLQTIINIKIQKMGQKNNFFIIDHFNFLKVHYQEHMLLGMMLIINYK